MRARRTVALAAFLFSSDVHLVDLDWTDQIKGRRIERFSEALDAPADHLVRDVDFHLELANTRVKSKERVDREQPFLSTIFECAKIVPVLSLKLRSQSLHRYR